MACNNSESKFNDEISKQASEQPGINAGANKFTITTPAGWKRLDTTDNGVKITYLLSPMDAGENKARINVITTSTVDVTLDSIINENILYMSKHLKKFNEKGIGNQNINGIYVKWLKYSVGSDSRDYKLYILIKNGVAYYITCSVAKNEIKKYQVDIDEAVNSFTTN